MHHTAVADLALDLDRLTPAQFARLPEAGRPAALDRARDAAARVEAARLELARAERELDDAERELGYLAAKLWSQEEISMTRR